MIKAIDRYLLRQILPTPEVVNNEVAARLRDAGAVIDDVELTTTFVAGTPSTVTPVVVLTPAKPVRSAASIVVPEPPKGSNTTSPESV
mgnify:CR=1 FL=1